MYLITFIILGSQAEILQSIPNKNDYLFPNLEQECKKIELQENENFYLEIKQEGNIFYRFSNDFQEQVNDKWNLTFIDFISQIELAPNYFSILYSEILQFEDGMFLCTLLQNQRSLDYSIYCKDVILQEYIEYKVKFSEIHEFSFLIVYQECLKCNKFLFFNQLFYILCLIEDQMQIITFDLKGNKQQHNFTISTQQCNLQYHLFQSHFLLVAFYQCINWEIILFDQDLEGLKRLTNEEIYLKAKSNSNKYLNDLFICQEALFLIFAQDYFQLRIEPSLVLDYRIDYNVQTDTIQKLYLLQLLRCTSSNQLISQYTINSMLTGFELKNLQSILKLEPYITFLIYNDHLIAMLTKEITQTIYIDINQFCLLQKVKNFFWIIDKQNRLSLFEINLFLNYFSYQSNEKYVRFYTIKNTEVKLIQCFEIIQYQEKQDKLKYQIESLKNKNYIIQIVDNFDNIKIYKSNFLLNRNIQFHFIFPSIFQLRIEQKETSLQCNLKRKQLNLINRFLFFRINSQNILLFNQKEILVIYHCNSQNFTYFNIKINLNFIKTYYSIQDVQLALVQETEGKIITIKLSNIAYNSINCQIHQFKEQIRLSFEYRNLLIIQLQNSKQIFFQSKEINTFTNESLYNSHYFNKQSSFQENVKDSIKVLNFHNMFIFQHESFLIVQVGQIVTQIINLKLLLLGGFLKKSQPLQIILIGMNYEMNRIDKYLITKMNFYKISSFYFEDFFPIQPLEYQIQEENLIITTQQLNKDSFYIILLFINQENRLESYEIIPTPYQYFYAISGILYYYNKNQELIEYNIKYFSFDFDLQEFNNIAYQLQLQIDYTNPYSQVDNNIQSEKLNLVVLNLQEYLKIANKSNPTIILNNNQAIINPNKFVLGLIIEFNLQNTTSFTLQNPFKVVQQKKCLNFNNNFCLIESDPQFIVQDITKNIEQNQTFPIRIAEYIMFQGCGDGIIFIQYFDLLNIKIQYFRQDMETSILIQGQYLNHLLIQSILKISTNLQTNYYFINEEITLIYFGQTETKLPDNFTYHQIDKDKICQIFIELSQIKISCFQIKHGVIFSISNYTIPILDIYNSISLRHYLPIFIQEAKIQILNLTSTLQNTLDVKIAVNYKKSSLRYEHILLFYVQITISDKEYQINLNNIIRLPKFNANCNLLILQNNLLYVCHSFQIFLYQLQNEFQLLDPYAVLQFSNEQFSSLNNTHITIFNYVSNELKIIQIDSWRLIKNDNISKEEEYNITFLVQNYLSKLELKVNVVNERKLENYQSFIRIGIIVINSLFIQIFIIIKKQKRI